uniref:Uncharacterized protein n=1 Tax=mine drainage metagenome TaxID=410659 RepID=E6QTG9_9ZZZZ
MRTTSRNGLFSTKLTYVPAHPALSKMNMVESQPSGLVRNLAQVSRRYVPHLASPDKNLRNRQTILRLHLTMNTTQNWIKHGME